MADVSKATGLAELPANVSLVSDKWLSESLGFKEMRDCTASRFLLEEKVTTITPVSVRQESFDDNARTSRRNLKRQLEENQDQLTDTLDELCEEAKGTQYLV